MKHLHKAAILLITFAATPHTLAGSEKQSFKSSLITQGQLEALENIELKTVPESDGRLRNETIFSFDSVIKDVPTVMAPVGSGLCWISSVKNVAGTNQLIIYKSPNGYYLLGGSVDGKNLAQGTNVAGSAICATRTAPVPGVEESDEILPPSLTLGCSESEGEACLGTSFGYLTNNNPAQTTIRGLIQNCLGCSVSYTKLSGDFDLLPYGNSVIATKTRSGNDFGITQHVGKIKAQLLSPKDYVITSETKDVILETEIIKPSISYSCFPSDCKVNAQESYGIVDAIAEIEFKSSIRDCPGCSIELSTESDLPVNSSESTQTLTLKQDKDIAGTSEASGTIKITARAPDGSVIDTVTTETIELKATVNSPVNMCGSGLEFDKATGECIKKNEICDVGYTFVPDNFLCIKEDSYCESDHRNHVRLIGEYNYMIDDEVVCKTKSKTCGKYSVGRSAGHNLYNICTKFTSTKAPNLMSAWISTGNSSRCDSDPHMSKHDSIDNARDEFSHHKMDGTKILSDVDGQPLFGITPLTSCDPNQVNNDSKYGIPQSCHNIVPDRYGSWSLEEYGNNYEMYTCKAPFRWHRTSQSFDCDLDEGIDDYAFELDSDFAKLDGTESLYINNSKLYTIVPGAPCNPNETSTMKTYGTLQECSEYGPTSYSDWIELPGVTAAHYVCTSQNDAPVPALPHRPVYGVWTSVGTTCDTSRPHQGMSYDEHLKQYANKITHVISGGKCNPKFVDKYKTYGNKYSVTDCTEDYPDPWGSWGNDIIVEGVEYEQYVCEVPEQPAPEKIRTWGKPYTSCRAYATISEAQEKLIHVEHGAQCDTNNLDPSKWYGDKRSLEECTTGMRGPYGTWTSAEGVEFTSYKCI